MIHKPFSNHISYASSNVNFGYVLETYPDGTVAAASSEMPPSPSLSFLGRVGETNIYPRPRRGPYHACFFISSIVIFFQHVDLVGMGLRTLFGNANSTAPSVFMRSSSISIIYIFPPGTDGAKQCRFSSTNRNCIHEMRVFWQTFNLLR